MGHGHDDGPVVVPESNGLTTSEVEQKHIEWGYNEIRDRSKKWYQVLWEQLYGDHWYPNSIPAMMWVAMIISAAIQDWPDAGVIFGLHMFNSGLSFYETMKAGDAVAALKKALAPTWQVFFSLPPLYPVLRCLPVPSSSLEL
jgi:H+-transporting ATPase